MGIASLLRLQKADLASSVRGVLEAANIQPLQEQLSKAKNFRCYHVDCYEEYQDLSDEAYRAELEAKLSSLNAALPASLDQPEL